MNSELRYYLSIFFKRMPIFLFVMLSFFAISVALALTLPPVYRSDAKLLVESAQIPNELASSTVQTNATEQLEIVQQRLMTRATLIEIARDHDVLEGIEDLNPDQIVAQMRAKTVFESTSGRDRATLLVIAFNGRTAQISARVVNDYVTRILNDNVRLRTGMAEDTLDFFEQEVTRLGTELELRSAKIVEFQSENSDALPDDQAYRLARQTTLQERLSQILRDRSLLDDHRARLIEVFETTGQLQSSSRRNLTPEQQQLADVQEQLASALTIYSEENPRVKMLKARIQQLEGVVASQTGVPDDNVSALDLQLAEIDARMSFLNQQADQIQKELATLAEAIRKTPANAIALETLEREYENTQQQYNAAVERLSKAATGERIELLSKGQRIAIIEQATAPVRPTSPNRPLIVGGGIFLGFAAGLGVIFILEMLNSAVRRPADLTTRLGITPLATVPYIRTRGQHTRQRLFQITVAVLILAVVALGLYMVDTYYLPLDLLWERFWERMSL